MAAADLLLAESLGVSPALVESSRREHLVEGVDFVRVPPVTGRIEYTDAGRDRIDSILGLKKNEGGPPAPVLPATPPGASQQPPAALPAPLRLKIVRLLPNPLWVAVAQPGGIVGDVRVRNRTSLRPGVLLLCQQHPDGRWECIHPGHASPLAITS